ncbi:MAG TPA: c-type cytochrome [bacterium]|nr:c-type cytochrome [bacterium]
MFGKAEKMTDGSTVTIDENYLRESILNPQAKIVAGYQPVMPTYQGILKDREIDAIIAYIKTLK